MILFSKEKNILVKRCQMLRKKKVHRILLIGLLDQASNYFNKLLEVHDEMGNTKLYRPAFRFWSNNVHLQSL